MIMTMTTSMSMSITIMTTRTANAAAMIMTMTTSMNITIMTMKMANAAAAIIMTTTITMPTRFSPASVVRPPANLPMTRFCMRWKHWTTATNMALSCVPRALFRVKTDSGFILTMYPERRMSVMAVPRSSAVCA